MFLKLLHRDRRSRTSIGCKTNTRLFLSMKTTTKCLALMALAEGVTAFAPASFSVLPRAGLTATCPARSLPLAHKAVRAAPLRLTSMQMAATNIPITVTGTNIEVSYETRTNTNLQ